MKRPLAILLSIFSVSIFLNVTPVLAAQPSQADTTSGPTSYLSFSRISETVVDYYKQPLQWQRKQWLHVGAVTALTLASMPMDNDIRTEVLEWRGEKNHILMQAGRWAGLGYPTVLLSAGLYTVGSLRDNPELQTTGTLILDAFLTGGLTTVVLKVIIGRHRPYLNDGPNAYTPPGKTIPHRALPSGHSVLGWLTFGVLAKQTDKVLLKATYYTSAGLISFSRIYHDKHWFSDTLLGAFIGYGAAEFVTSRAERENRKQARRWSVAPVVGIEHVGVVVRF